MAQPRSAVAFYQFLAIHSLLIGLLPFFLPVYLWGQGFSLAALSLLIGVSGLSFCAVLGLWQLAAARLPLSMLLGLSFLFEGVLVALIVVIGDEPTAAILLGAANGVYNAFFWTTQRTLFVEGLGNNDTGRQYGNFQLFVTVFLKVGILIGGLLLDAGGIAWLFGVSALIGVAGTLWFWHALPRETLYGSTGAHTSSVTLRSSLAFVDRAGSRPVFTIDGLFLLLESHFWTLSLFLVVREDYSRLGIVVIVLALVFAALFYLLKNTIDRTDGARVYSVAVALYAASWLLRAWLDGDESTQVLLVLLILITFCSSMFRLAFNKRFFDETQRRGGVQYLLVKSYLSQWWLGLGYLLLAGMLAASELATSTILASCYVLAAVLSLGYFAYRPERQSR